jgi:serine/threonine-protein kinase
MGEVYQATDTKLKRQVAIKVLPAAVGADHERLSRFQREAEVLASLNHPNIAAIYGLEDMAAAAGSGQGASKALVMELVEGPTLADRIADGPIPIDEALPIVRQIAEALEAAHERGIIHRDLKPANVKVRPDGTVKVLDFGLAKALEPVGAMSASVSMAATITTPAMTQAGMILGTAAYMSPEQARGKVVDRRADIWAFGAVLFEMLTGSPPFPGDDISHVLARVIERDPDWAALPPALSPALATYLRRCLVKDPRQRMRDIGDVRLALDGAFDTAVPPPTSAPTSPDARWTRATAFRLAGLAAVFAAAIAGVGVWLLSGTATEGTAPIARLAMTLPDDQELSSLESPALAVSPQGTLVAYVAVSGGRQQLHVRAIDGVESTALAGTEQASNPFFSPDGQWIGFFAQGQLKKASVAAGTIQVLCDAPSGRGGSWAGDSIYFAATNVTGLSRVSADGGVPVEVTTLSRSGGEISHRWPQVLPGGSALMFDVWTGPGRDEQQVVVERLDGGERIVVVQGGGTGHYVSSGHVIYARRDELFAVPFDVESLRVSGQASRLSETVWGGGEGAQYAVSDNGVFVSVAGSLDRYQKRLVWVDRNGRVEPVAAPPQDYHGNAVISPDGRRAAVDIEGGTVGIWIYDFSRGTLTPLTTGPGSSQAPRWTPDGTRIVYRGTRTGLRNLWWKTVDDGAEEERLTTGDGVQTPSSWSNDGQWLVYNDTGSATGGDIWVLPSSGERTPRAVVVTPFGERAPRLSPDGRWLAYASDASGRFEVFLQQFPEPSGRTQISVAGGTEPVWSRDGRELFFQNGDAMMAVEIQTSPALRVGAPRMLFEGRYAPSQNSVASYDVSADGQRFLRIQPVHPDPSRRQIEVVLNWFEELRRLGRSP